MSTIYDRGRALAIRQLAPISQGGKGQTVTLTYTSPGAWNETTQAMGSATTTAQTCSGVEKNIKVERVDGSLILVGDSEFVLSPVTTAGVDVSLPDALPELATLTLTDGRVLTVVRVEHKRSSGLLLSATLQLRRGG